MIVDKDVQQSIQAELQWLPMINAANLQVSVNRGTATISGHVATFQEKIAVEEAIKRIKGVKSLVEDIKIQPALPCAISDAAIAAAVAQAISWHAGVPAQRIHITVKDGYLTLDGDVEWQYQKDHAYDAVKYISGIKGISNFLFIKPRANAALIESDIIHALERKADFRPLHITVQAKGNSVTLQGKVRNWAERQMAEYAAWSSPGVADVKDELEVVG